MQSDLKKVEDKAEKARGESSQTEREREREREKERERRRDLEGWEGESCRGNRFLYFSITKSLNFSKQFLVVMVMPTLPGSSLGG